MLTRQKELDPVLILDDEAIIAFDLADELAEHGRTVLPPALSLEQADALLETHKPRSAILDIDLSGKQVWPLARRLKSRGCRLLFISANLTHRELTEEFSDSAKLEKPANSADIIRALQRLVS